MRKRFTLLLTPFLLAISIQSLAQGQLFISELADPADDYTGRFIELYNPGPSAVDLSTNVFYISRQSNGGTTFGEVQLTGIIDSGSTYVLGGSAFEAIYGFAPDLVTGILIGNGDDAYYLFRDGDHTTGLIQDIFGVPDTDGTGEPWEYTDSRALRLESVTTPNSTWTTTEWTITSANTTDVDPGTHYGTTPVIPGDLSMSVISDTVDLGQVLRLGIDVDGLEAGDEIIAWQFILAYDATIISYQGSELTGTLSEGGTLAVNDAIAGQLSISYMHTQALAGNGSILYLDFSTLLPDTSGVTISAAYLNDMEVSTLNPGVAIVRVTAPPEADLSYNMDSIRFAETLQIDAQFSAPMDEAVPVWLNLTGAMSLNGLEMTRLDESSYRLFLPVPATEGGEVQVEIAQAVDIWGNAALGQPVSGASFYIFPFLKGDVNDDGSIQAYDAALGLQHSVGMDPLLAEDPLPWENWRDSAANVDGSPGISAYDAGLILQFSAGLISSFPGSATKSAMDANVGIVVDQEGVTFYGEGYLLGLNIDILEGASCLGVPEVLAQDYLSAVNKDEAAIRIGLCTAYPREGAMLCRIPIEKDGKVEMLLRLNDRSEHIILNLSTGTGEIWKTKPYLYPNPAMDQVRVCGFEGSSRVKVCGIVGQMLLQVPEVIAGDRIDLSSLAPGLYFMHVQTGKESHLLRFIKGESR